MKHPLQLIAVFLPASLPVVPGATAATKPLKVFILAGQSNMQGHANTSTLDSMADDPKTAPILKEMRNADGTPRVCDKVWMSSIGCAGDDTTEQKGKLTAGFGASAARQRTAGSGSTHRLPALAPGTPTSTARQVTRIPPSHAATT